MEVCVYNNGVIVVGFVEVIDIGYWDYVWIFVGFVVVFVSVFFVLVKNMVNKWWN